MADKKKKLLTIDQVSSLCQVSRENILSWMRSNLIDHSDSMIDLCSLTKLSLVNQQVFQPTNNVLIMDDETDQIETLEMIFFSKKMKCLGTKDPYETLMFLRTHQPKLLTLDLHMDTIGGLEMLKLISALDLKQSTWIVVISGADQEELERAITLGADFYLEKPISKSDLDKIILKVSGEKMAS